MNCLDDFCFWDEQKLDDSLWVSYLLEIALSPGEVGEIGISAISLAGKLCAHIPD